MRKRLLDGREVRVDHREHRLARLAAATLQLDDLADLVEPEPERLRLADEPQQRDLGLGIGPVPGLGPIGGRQEALVRYDPRQVGPERITQTLRAIGSTVRDPGKGQAFEEQEAELAEAYGRLLAAVLFTLLSLFLMALV